MQIKECLTKDVKWTTPDTTATEIAKMMKENDIGSVPIGENDKLTGMVTDRDIVVNCLAEGLNPSETSASEFMSEGVLYCYDTDSAEEVLENMGQKKISRMPVVNSDKRLVGIVSIGDLSSHFPNNEKLGKTVENIKEAA